MQTIAELPFIAGHLALDFVNSAEQRGDPEAGDALVTVADLRLWGRRYGLIGRAGARDGRPALEFEQARGARELLYALFLARAQDRPLPRTELAQLAELAAEAYQAARLQVAPDGSVHWRWSPSSLATIRHVAVTSAVELLQEDPSPRLKQCPGAHCGWFFLDATKRGNRRWCSMDECGQDAKNLARRRSGASGSAAR